MFRKIEVKDKVRFDQLQMKDYVASELNFANIFAWKNFDQLEIYDNEDMIIIKGKDFFFPPLVKNNNYSKAIQIIKDYCQENNFVFNFVGITNELLPFFNFPNTIIYSHNELNEYLYNSSDLISFKGKKFHSKRNLINQFERNYQFQYVAYNENLKTGIINLIDNWIERKSLTFEKEGIISLLDNLNTVNCFCDCLIIENKVQAFSIGTISNNVGIVLFEKANTDYIGIYPAIVSYFARKHYQSVQYINRQEDMGIENLRISKMSYNPCGFIRKYQLTKTIDYQLQDIYHLSFHDSPAYQDFFFNKKEKQVKYITSNNIITSALYYRDETLVIKNKEVKVAFIFALATHPLYRYLGYMKQLLTFTLQQFANEYLFVYLHSNVDNFYEQFDFVQYQYPFYITNNINNQTDNLDDVIKIYDVVSLQANAYIKRDLNKWQKVLEEIQIDNGNIYIDNKTYQLNDSSNIIESLSRKDNSLLANNKMLRILNLKSFLDIFNITYNYSVIDNIIHQNNISTSDINTKQTNIKELSQLILKNLIILALEKY